MDEKKTKTKPTRVKLSVKTNTAKKKNNENVNGDHRGPKKERNETRGRQRKWPVAASATCRRTIEHRKTEYRLWYCHQGE